MKNTIWIISFLLVTIAANSQTPDKAKEILDKLSAKTKSYTSISTTFNYTLENSADGIKETQDGKLITQGDKYNLSIGGQQIICNGKTIWTYLPDAGEVQITDVPSPEEMEEEDYISPNTIFTMYEKGFKYKYVKEEVLKGRTVQLINLYPVKADERSYHTIRLYIDNEKLQISQLLILGKDGTNYTYVIENFETNKATTPSTFTFDKSAHPGVDVNDMR